MNNYQGPRPLTIGTRFININSGSLQKVMINMDKVNEAIKVINKETDFAKPLDPVINRGLYDDDYVRTVILSGNVKAFRDMIINPNLNGYLRDLYKLQLSEESKLDDKQKEGLKKLDLRFNSSKAYEQNELTYINNLVDLYIDDVLPILKKNEQEVLVEYVDGNKERISLYHSIMLINE